MCFTIKFVNIKQIIVILFNIVSLSFYQNVPRLTNFVVFKLREETRELLVLQHRVFIPF